MSNLDKQPHREGPRLPIDAIRSDFSATLARGPVVVSSPTGSGKSTQVPRWCPSPVLVIEPRRVACRSLAQRVAELEGTALGDRVGYQVRDERRDSAATQIVFATPGIVLQQYGDISRFNTVVVDEFHERRLDTDLLLALLRDHVKSLVVMSATLDGDRVAKYLDGVHLRAEGRQFPVRVSYAPGSPDLPDARDIEERVVRAVRGSADDPGDVLVFLPGKGEIAMAARALERSRLGTVVELHGGLTLEQQARAFEAHAARKIILATNVAETSITVPGVGVVIDSGLVRRTRYHQGRGHLTLLPIAHDSAEQRAGRAGRTAPGVCYRLWSPRAKLTSHTPPEVHRESLVPLVLGAAACGTRADALQFLDPPKDHALDLAKEELHRLDALDADGALTERGRRIHGLPIDPWLGRLLVEALNHGVLDDCIDLVAALSVDRPLFVRRPDDEDDDLRVSGCDVTALIRAIREGRPQKHGLDPMALNDARDTARRLRRALELTNRSQKKNRPNRDELVRIAVQADQRAVYVARRRRGRTAWANGGTEIELGRESAVQDTEKLDAIIVFDSRAIGTGPRGSRVVATCATAVSLSALAKLGVGRERVSHAVIHEGNVLARVEKVYAKRVLATREEPPTGDLAREAIADLFLRGAVFPEALALTRERLAATRLAARLIESGLVPRGSPVSAAELDDWVRQRVSELGVESGEDLNLIEATDLTAPELPYEIRSIVEREFPLRIDVGDASYAVEYDLGRKQALLKLVSGHRKTPPPAAYLPRFGGFRVFAEAQGTLHPVR